jgi:hypothetical protein
MKLFLHPNTPFVYNKNFMVPFINSGTIFEKGSRSLKDLEYWTNRIIQNNTSRTVRQQAAAGT